MSEHPTQESSTEAHAGRKRFFHLWRCFWLAVLAISLPYAWYCFYAPPNDIAWTDNYSSAEQQAIETDKPIILYFTGTWCVPCRIMKRQVWADRRVASLVNEQYIPFAVDVDNPDYADLMTRYKVTGPPVTIVTDPQGNALSWRAGGVSKLEFFELLEEVELLGKADQLSGEQSTQSDDSTAPLADD